MQKLCLSIIVVLALAVNANATNAHAGRIFPANISAASDQPMPARATHFSPLRTESLKIVPIPEPSVISIMALAVGLAGMIVCRRKPV